MRLSKNFTYEELTRSATAERKGLRNRPKTKEEEKKVIENPMAECETLDEREKGIIISW